MGIEILPPDVNQSDHEFIVVEGDIRFGLDAVKGVGFSAVEAIKRAREDGHFASLWDFCERVDGRARQQAGDRGADQVRRVRLDRARRARGCSACSRQAQAAGAEVAAGRADRPGLDLRPRRETGRRGQRRGGRVRRAAAIRRSRRGVRAGELLAVEKESIGLFISAHPLKAVREALRLKVDCPLAELAGRRTASGSPSAGSSRRARRCSRRSKRRVAARNG